MLYFYRCTFPPNDAFTGNIYIYSSQHITSDTDGNGRSGYDRICTKCATILRRLRIYQYRNIILHNIILHNIILHNITLHSSDDSAHLEVITWNRKKNGYTTSSATAPGKLRMRWYAAIMMKYMCLSGARPETGKTPWI